MMEVIGDCGLGLVHKRAQTAEERRRLEHEAAILQAVAHPGVVQLVGVEGGDPPDGLVLRQVPGGDLAALDDQSAEVVAGIGAALATTVADLHDVGVSHGAIEPSHVLLDQEGRPVLCSFGRAERARHAAEAEVRRRDDVRALARLLLEHLPAGLPSRAARTLRVAAGPGRPHRSHDARWLARQLVLSVPDARLPDPSDVAARRPPVDLPAAFAGNVRVARPAWLGGRLTSDRIRRPAAVAAGLGLLGTGMAVVTALSGSGHSPRSASVADRAAEWSAAACPPIDDGCGPIARPDGILTTPTGRYQVAAPGDVTVVGRWRCGPTALPALLSPATGEVWTFDAWPTAARAEVGRLAARIDSAWSLRVRPQRSGCDVLEVERRGLPPVSIDAVGR